MAFKIGSNTVVFDNQVVKVRSGTTAQRDALTAATGLVQGATWWNIDSKTFNIYDGVNWIDIGPEYEEGQAWSWGRGFYGRLGDNTTVEKSSPVSVVGGFTDWCQISAGWTHTLAVRQNGTAWAWSTNSDRQLGDNTTTQRLSPVSVVGGFTDWCQVTTGRFHSLGVRQSGTIWAWGCGSAGRLGNNSVANRASPVAVAGGFTNWCQVSAGGSHSLAVRQNGTAWAWGFNLFGQLGTNNTNAPSSPVAVVGGFTDWCQISGGINHSLAVRQNGTLWAWGLDGSGRLGNNTTNRSSPVAVLGGFTDWCQVSGGDYHSLAVRQNGTAWAWGDNANGKLGTNNTTGRTSPVQVVGGFTDWCQISAGLRHSLAVRQNGTAWAWGANGFGYLGDNTTTDRLSPVQVVGGFTDWCQVSAGGFHSQALRSPQ